MTCPTCGQAHRCNRVGPSRNGKFVTASRYQRSRLTFPVAMSTVSFSTIAPCLAPGNPNFPDVWPEREACPACGQATDAGSPCGLSRNGKFVSYHRPQVGLSRCQSRPPRRSVPGPPPCGPPSFRRPMLGSPFHMRSATDKPTTCSGKWAPSVPGVGWASVSYAERDRQGYDLFQDSARTIYRRVESHQRRLDAARNESETARGLFLSPR